MLRERGQWRPRSRTRYQKTGNRKTGNRKTGNRKTGNLKTRNQKTRNQKTGNRNNGGKGDKNKSEVRVKKKIMLGFLKIRTPTPFFSASISKLQNDSQPARRVEDTGK